MRRAWHVVLIAPVNWKVVIEAFNEGYHAGATHVANLEYQKMHAPVTAYGPHTMYFTNFGEHARAPYRALEYLPGGTLGERVGGPRMPPRDAAALVAKLAAAVQAAHDAGIVHRDLKPGNVLFDEKGEP